MVSLLNPALFKDQALINGIWCDAQSQLRTKVINPATLEFIGSIPNMTDVETKFAIESSKNAFSVWKKYTAKERSTLLKKWYDLILINLNDLAKLITIEQGKPLVEARGEVLYGASFIEWFSEQARRIEGETIASPSNDRRLLTIRQPIGVCAAITPWNFPAAMITRKVAPALAAGCTMILKPASQTPFSALALAELALQAGIPPGVFNVITGDPSPIAHELTHNSTVRKLTFTGSTPIGSLLMAHGASHIQKSSMELGGNAPFIVFEDADIDAAVEGAIISKFRNNGQTCVCSNRFYIHTLVYDEFIQKLKAKVEALKIGNGLNDCTSIGPFIDENAFIKNKEFITDAVSKGAELICGGERIYPDGLNGFFMSPAILINVDNTMRVSCEEIFGPIAPIMQFSDEKEVILKANDTEFGLASYFYTQSLARTWRVSEALEYGMVGINTGLISTTEAPFGGIKQSGLGREGSKHGIDEYLEIKYLCMGISS
ncbi:NAD-dependent succinate-semialdehyde dehydrogenase [Thorsellia kenyensis]|uniref:NAD-dependent succinate-semialdehyde dehydrogenase n=1 Tax=Thorsellia kenyensis TaxID=1549888 RepID=A0ABV6CAN0_9GAMM